MGKIEVTLVDSSSWIEALRKKGRIDVRERVKSLLIDGAAAWRDMVAVELWNGARGAYEKKRLLELEKDILCLPTTTEVWFMARRLAEKCRGAGMTAPSADLVIASCALIHGADIEHCDEHIDFIINLGKKSGVSH